MLLNVSEAKTGEEAKQLLDEAIFQWHKQKIAIPEFIIMRPELFFIVKSDVLYISQIMAGTILSYRGCRLIRSVDLKKTELIIC